MNTTNELDTINLQLQRDVLLATTQESDLVDLICQGANPWKPDPQNGRCSLHLAAMSRHINAGAILRYFSSLDGDIDCIDHEGRTPLMLNIIYAKGTNSRVLVHLNADPEKKDQSERSAIDYARSLNDVRTLALFPKPQGIRHRAPLSQRGSTQDRFSTKSAPASYEYSKSTDQSGPDDFLDDLALYDQLEISEESKAQDDKAKTSIDATTSSSLASRKLFDSGRARARLAQLDDKPYQEEQLKRLLKSGTSREMASVTRTTLARIAELEARFPHFHEIISFYQEQVALSCLNEYA